MSSMVIILQ